MNAKKIVFGVMGATTSLLALAACSSGSPGQGPEPTAPYHLVDGTYDGKLVTHSRGPVQVRITVAGGKITKAEAIQQPTAAAKSQTINTKAIPILNQETVDAQSTHIDFVSGATLTSKAYVDSLQDAIDQANKG